MVHPVEGSHGDCQERRPNLRNLIRLTTLDVRFSHLGDAGLGADHRAMFVLASGDHKATPFETLYNKVRRSRIRHQTMELPPIADELHYFCVFLFMISRAMAIIFSRSS